MLSKQLQIIFKNPINDTTEIGINLRVWKKQMNIKLSLLVKAIVYSLTVAYWSVKTSLEYADPRKIYQMLCAKLCSLHPHHPTRKNIHRLGPNLQYGCICRQCP